MITDPVAALQALLASDPEGLGAVGLADVTHRSRTVRAFLDEYDARCSRRADQLHAAGEGVPADELHKRSGGVSAAEARRRQRRAQVLDKAPEFAAALAEGRVGAEHVDVLAAVTNKLDGAIVSGFFDRQSELLSWARRESPELFKRRCQTLIGMLQANAGIDRDGRQRSETRLSRRIDAHGMHHLSAVMHPELGAAVFAAIDAETAALVAAGGDREVDRQRLAAEALGNLVSGGHQRRRPHEPEITVIIDADTLVSGEHEHSVCELGNGTPVLPDTVRRWCCQGKIIPILIANGVVLDAGREIRFANRAQKRALRAMYRTCGFAGCDIPFERCEIHHITPWEDGGATDLENLIPICSRHHHMVHEQRWRIELNPQRQLSIYRPDGELHAVVGTPIESRTKQGSPPGRGSPPTNTEPAHLDLAS